MADLRLSVNSINQEIFVWRKVYQDAPIPTTLEFNVQVKTSFGVLQSKLSLILLKLRIFFPNKERKNNRTKLTAASL